MLGERQASKSECQHCRPLQRGDKVQNPNRIKNRFHTELLTRTVNKRPKVDNDL